MALQNTGANDDWWKYQIKWSGITESVQHGRIRPSVGQQYRQELVRQNKLERPCEADGSLEVRILEEREGFEPSEPCGSPDFEPGYDWRVIARLDAP